MWWCRAEPLDLDRNSWLDAPIPAVHSACVITELTIIAPGRVPALLPVEVAAIVHWACFIIERPQALAGELETNRETAISKESPPDAGEVDAEYLHEATTEFYRENGGPVGPVTARLDEFLSPARLLAYCRLFEGVPVYAPYMERFYLVDQLGACPGMRPGCQYGRRLSTSTVRFNICLRDSGYSPIVAPGLRVSTRTDELPMGRCFIPSNGPAAWRAFLAQPEKQWRTGYSAKTLAHCWEAGDQLPKEVASLIKTHPRFEAEKPELLLAIPEWKVPLRGGRRHSQNDVLALIGVGDELVVATVEGKVSESFGETIESWFANPSDGKRERLGYLCELLGMSFPPDSHLRYQLFHRAASAVIECKRFRAPNASYDRAFVFP